MWLRAAFLLTVAGWGANQFSPLLAAYQRGLGVSGTAVTGLFALYVVGLVPGLLLGGPLADRRGRRPVVLGAVLLNGVATLALMAGVLAVPWLAVGRVLTGLGTGAVLAAGTAWVRELTLLAGTTDDGAGARRAGVLLSAGFSLSGLVAALLAQWAPRPLVVAYLPHLVLCVAGLLLALACPETRPSRPAATRVRQRDRRFRALVLPVALWVFVGPSISFGVLPGQVAPAEWETLHAGLAALLAPGTGALVQPLARRLAARGERVPAVVGLGLLGLGLALAALTAARGMPLAALACCALLGAGYGCCSTYCLTVVGRIAAPGGLARLTSVFWVVAYLGFAAPYLFALAAPVADAPALLAGLAVLALLTGLRSARHQPDRDGQERRDADQVQRVGEPGVPEPVGDAGGGQHDGQLPERGEHQEDHA
ncbi:MFS transporter [Saccharopolyspora cebuensis]